MPPCVASWEIFPPEIPSVAGSDSRGRPSTSGNSRKTQSSRTTSTPSVCRNPSSRRPCEPFATTHRTCWVRTSPRKAGNSSIIMSGSWREWWSMAVVPIGHGLASTPISCASEPISFCAGFGASTATIYDNRPWPRNPISPMQPVGSPFCKHLKVVSPENDLLRDSRLQTVQQSLFPRFRRGNQSRKASRPWNSIKPSHSPPPRTPFDHQAARQAPQRRFSPRYP
jgi:hypothetical protein